MKALLKHKTVTMAASFILAFFALNPVSHAAVKKPKLNAKSAVVMNMNTGKVLFQKNPYLKRNQASLTKLMTVTLAMEANKPAAKVKINKAVSRVKYSKFSLKAGDVYYVRDLAYGAMLPSSNGCAEALAYKTGPGLKSFIKKMNVKAKKLGCKRTHFVNSHGLPNRSHYSCAYDCALILRYAYNNPYVRTYMGTKKKTIVSLKNKRKVRLVNSNNLLRYKNVVGGKTGHSDMAKYCLACVYQYKDETYAVVTLGNSSFKARTSDQKKLYKYIRGLTK